MASLDSESSSSSSHTSRLKPPSPMGSSFPTRNSSPESSEQQILPPSIGRVLVIGGCGFLGHHIVKFLSEEATTTSISVMSRSPFQNRFEDIAYHIGDISNLSHVRHVLAQVKPNVIINTASPHAYKDHEHVPEVYKTNIDGNQNLLTAAAEIGTVKVFVYTSSGPIIASSGKGYHHADETNPTLAHPILKKGDPYHIAKALGDKFVLESNGKNGIRTCTIRPTALYGEGDGQMIGPTIKALEDGQTNIWMGYNNIEMDVVYVGHVALAHVLAVKGLLAEINDPSAPKIGGEAFNITDDEPSPPLTFFRRYWALAGDRTPLEDIWMIPPFLVMFLAHLAEWTVWITSFGKSRPESLKVERMEFILYTRTYSILKARTLLGFEPWKYQPHSNQQAALEASVAWYLHPSNHGPIHTSKYPSWPQTPFRLISNTGYSTTPNIPKDHYCIENARIMAMTHNTIFRALNAIYLHSRFIQPKTESARHLLEYAAITYEFIHHHHLIEETFYFPAIEKATGIPDLMAQNLSQHRELEDGLERFRKYVEGTRKEDFSGKKLRAAIDGFRESFERHLHEEIGSILELGLKIDSAVLKGIEEGMRREAERWADVFKIAPFVLSNQDRTFYLDDKHRSFPNTYFPIPQIVSLFLSPRHKGVWEFSPSNMNGYPKALPGPSPVNKSTSAKSSIKKENGNGDGSASEGDGKDNERRRMVKREYEPIEEIEMPGYELSRRLIPDLAWESWMWILVAVLAVVAARV